MVDRKATLISEAFPK